MPSCRAVRCENPWSSAFYRMTPDARSLDLHCRSVPGWTWLVYTQGSTEAPAPCALDLLLAPPYNWPKNDDPLFLVDGRPNSEPGKPGESLDRIAEISRIGSQDCRMKAAWMRRHGCASSASWTGQLEECSATEPETTRRTSAPTRQVSKPTIFIKYTILCVLYHGCSNDTVLARPLVSYKHTAALIFAFLVWYSAHLTPTPIFKNHVAADNDY